MTVEGVLALEGCRATLSPEEHATIERMDWTTQYVQLVPGRFQGALYDVEVGGVTIGREAYNLPMEELFFSPPKRLFYARGMTSQPSYCEGRRLCEGLGILCSDKVPIHFLIRGGYSGFYVAVDHALAEKLEPDRDWGSVSKPWMHVSPLETTRLDAMIHALLRLIGESPASACIRGCAEDIALAVLDLTLGEEARKEPPPTSMRSYVFNKARSVILDSLDSNISVSDICATLRVSARTLAYSFEDLVGVGPKKYILAQRLARVRSDILRNCGREDILDVAHRWGFNHASRFAAQYNRHFDELPSQTGRGARSISTRIVL